MSKRGRGLETSSSDGLVTRFRIGWRDRFNYLVDKSPHSELSSRYTLNQTSFNGTGYSPKSQSGEALRRARDGNGKIERRNTSR